jgi:hypothetical protein
MSMMYVLKKILEHEQEKVNSEFIFWRIKWQTVQI